MVDWRKLVADGVAGAFVFVHLLGDDVAGSFQGVFHTFDFAFHESGCPGFEVGLPLQEEHGGQGFQPFLAGCLGTGFPFGLERQVDVFQLREFPGVMDALFQRLGELALLADGGADGLFALGDVAQLIVLFLDLLNLHFIQSAGSFLAVAADERDGCSVVEQGLVVPAGRVCRL